MERYSYWNAQKKVKGHYPQPLDYSLLVYKILNFDGRYRDGEDSNHNPTYTPTNPHDASVEVPPGVGDLASGDLSRANNKAYQKFVDSMKDSAQNANNIAESGKSLGQIMQHVRSISSSIEHIRKGDVIGAAEALGAKLSKSKASRIKRRAKQAADRWLELHFGWEPLVQDIGSSIDIMQGTGKSSTSLQRINGRAHFQGSTSSSSIGFNGTLLEKRYSSDSWSGGVRMGGLVAVENPNLAVANQMGFVNPLSVAWEAVPFSFVVDWFSNVGQCLSAMTDFWGYQLKEGYTSTRVKVVSTRNLSQYVYFGTGPLDYVRDVQTEYYNQGRGGGITSPVFTFTPLKSISVARGATAISLLVQQMSKIG
jgi:hypothetical protein